MKQTVIISGPRLDELKDLKLSDLSSPQVLLLDLQAPLAHSMVDGAIDGENFLKGEDLNRYRKLRGTNSQPTIEAQRFATFRNALYLVLASALGCSHQEIQITVSAKGKPEVLSPKSDLRFSISHTGHFLLIGLIGLIGLSSSASIGVDIEEIRRTPKTMLLAKRFMTPSESESLARLSESEQQSAFTRIWSLKESIVKALGTGMFEHMSSIEIQLIGDGDARVLRLPEKSPSIENWSHDFLFPDHADMQNYICTAALVANLP